jgi:hypothetical protein
VRAGRADKHEQEANVSARPTAANRDRDGEARDAAEKRATELAHRPAFLRAQEEGGDAAWRARYAHSYRQHDADTAEQVRDESDEESTERRRRERRWAAQERAQVRAREKRANETQAEGDARRKAAATKERARYAREGRRWAR